MQYKTKIALVDDHVLLRNGLASLITSFGNYEVIFEAANGHDMIAQLKKNNLPDLVLLDINMPEMDGFETCNWLNQRFPQIKVLALSMYDNESAILRMFKVGARGYILKDSDPAELRTAIETILAKGYYYTEMVTETFFKNLHENTTSRSAKAMSLSDRETTFLRFACSELTYREIADKMNVSHRTIDGYREEVFRKLEVKSRVGLAMAAIKMGIYTP